MLIDQAIVGDSCAGTRATMLGEIDNLNYANTNGGAEIDYVYTAPNKDAHELTVYCDGDLAAKIPTDESSAAVTNLADGDHTLAILPQHIGSVYGHRHGADLGQRLYATWTRQAGTNGYRVYVGATLATTITDITFDEQVNQPSDAGGGRITVTGKVNTYQCGDLTLSIDATASQINVSWPDSTFAVDIVPGGEVSIGYGLWLTAQDDVADYPNGGLWTIPVGPGNEWVSDIVDPGTYVVSVKAIDEAGNESNAIDSVTIVIDEVPEPVLNASLTYGEGGVVLAEWGLGGVYDDIHIYSNIVSALGDQGLDDPVIDMDAPTAILAGDATDWSFDNPYSAQGVLNLYVLPVVDGRVCTDRRLLSMNLPPEPIDLGIHLGAVANALATPTECGGIMVTWNYFISEEDDLTGFRVVMGTMIDTTVLLSTGTNVPFASFLLDRTGEDFTGQSQPVTVTITPYNVAGGVTTYGTASTCSCTADADAPSVSGHVTGYAQ